MKNFIFSMILGGLICSTITKQKRQIKDLKRLILFINETRPKYDLENDPTSTLLSYMAYRGATLEEINTIKALIEKYEKAF